MKIEIKDGVVTNDGAELGIIQDGICHLTQKCAPIVKGEIRKAAGNAELKFIVGEAPDTDEIPDALPPSEPPPAPVVENNPADPKPARDPILGAKCPKLLAWQARNQKGGK